MKKKTINAETDADLKVWAKGVAEAVTADELTLLVADYQKQARNARRSETDREFAKRRGNALAKFVKPIS